jgi:hypothetical protein
VRAKPSGKEITTPVSWLAAHKKGKKVSLLFADLHPQFDPKQMGLQFLQQGVDVSAYDPATASWLRPKKNNH